VSAIGIPSKRSLRRVGRTVLVETQIAGRRLANRGSLPEFVIVGAQRSGTTSLFRCLMEHPAIIPNVLGTKGVHFFDTNYSRSIDWYLSHFASKQSRLAVESSAGQPAIAGEASPYYLYHPAGAQRMKALIPDAKMIVLLRDPVARAQSHYEHMVWEGYEPLPTLEDALDAEPERLAGEAERLLADPTATSHAHQHFSYIDRGRYDEQLARLFEHYPRKQVLVIATDELTSDPDPVLLRVQSFLGLEPDPAITLARRNAGDYDKLAPATRDRLTAEFAANNRRLTELLDCEFSWT